MKEKWKMRKSATFFSDGVILYPSTNDVNDSYCSMSLDLLIWDENNIYIS